jgi:S-adenosylmethionine hydrolase
MAIITIISDYGLKDPFVAALKGNLYQEIDNPAIEEITHQIPPFNLRETAHVLNSCYQQFPERSIHLLCVDEEVTANKKVMVMFFDNHYFVGVDNGLFSLIYQERKDFELVLVDGVLTEDANTTREIFVKIAGHLNRGGKMAVLGKKISEGKTLALPKASITNNNKTIIGGVMYIDHFGNAVTNISKALFNEIGKGQPFEINLPQVRKGITKTLEHYGEAKTEGSSIAVFNSSNMLEIAIYKPGGKYNNGAHTLLGLNIDDKITIDFKG